MNSRKTQAMCVILAALMQLITAQTIDVEINLDVKHTVGNVSEFNREKFVNIHADITENDWNNHTFTSDMRNDFLNGYDVYLGRNTGGIQWNLNGVVGEDPSRSGYANPADITTSGQSIKDGYAANTNYHAYESRNKQILCAQLHPFWPDGQNTNNGWAFSQTDNASESFGTASGEYMGRFIRDAYGNGGTSGQDKPNLIEVINEPLWHLTDYGTTEPEKVFRFHNAVISEVKKYNPNDNLQIGGFCTAFPDLEKNNFSQWNERWKQYMDIAGANTDFWTIHLYDFPSISGGKQKYRKGANMEATFDMMEQYSYMKFGVAKPFMISEYGAQMHDYFGAWSAYRDWLHLKSVNSMMMQFMERADIVNKAINFLPLKAEWGTTGVNDTYNHRLLRKANEPTAYTGDWVYSDMVKTYQLWSDVNGVRVDSKSSNPDIMTDVYIDGNKVYILLNNLDFTAYNINLDIAGTSNSLQSVNLKHLYLKDNAPVLDELTLTTPPGSYTLQSEGMMILEYTYASNITINETSNEVKYYADAYLKALSANSAQIFNINGVSAGTYGEAILRVGVGRDHGKSLSPTIKVNGTSIAVPTNFRGGPQTDREGYFGVLEIPVPYNLLQTNNVISVSFPDAGGYISSVAMQVFNFSKDIRDQGSAELPAPWETADIGAVGATGSASHNNGGFTVAGSGADIWNTADEFRYVYQSYSADVEVVAQVNSITNTNGWAKAGVMIRSNLTAGSVHAMTVITPSNGANLQYRATANGVSGNVKVTGITAPKYVKIRKEGTTITSSYSSDGDAWTAIGTQTVDVGSLFYIGLCVTSHSDGVLSTAVFDNVTISPVNTQIPVTGITITPENLNLEVGASGNVTSVVIPSNATIQTMSFTSQYPSVATVAPDGVVTAVAAGTTIITATSTEGGFTATSTVTVTNPNGQQAYPNGVPHAIPGSVESVNFDAGGEGVAYHDVTTGNAGSGPRQDENVDTESRITAGSVGWIATDEWLEYTVDVASAGDYVIEVMVASINSNGRFHIEFNGIDKTGLQSVTSTGDWGVFTTITISGVSLTAGTQVMRVFMDVGSFNLATINISEEFIANVIVLECEDLDRTGGTFNDGNVPYGVNIAAGLGVNWVNSDDYFEFDVNVSTSGEYQIAYQVSTPMDNAQVQFVLDGTTISTDNVPNNGQWDSYTALNASSNANISAGLHVIKILASGTNAWQWNMDKINLTRLGAMKSAGQELNTELSDIRIYPNPASDVITIEGVPAGISYVQIYNIQGMEFLNIQVDFSLENSISVQELPTGIYILSVKNSNLTKTVKLSKVE